jgi:outer membrane receptor protein involved in Fe transport
MIHLFYNNGHHEAERYPTDTDSYEQDDMLYGARVVESAKLFKGNKITVGADVRKWGGTSKNLVTDVYFVKDKYLTDSSVFGLIEQRILDAFTLSGGARYTDDSEFGGFTAWQGGLIVNPTEYFKIHSTVAKGFSLPNLRQLYIKMFPAEVPNPDLDPEIYMSYDAGIELTPVKDLMFDVTGYHISADDMIVKDGPGWTNADEFKYNGLEATAKYTIMNMVGLRAGYSYIDNEYRNAKLPYVPKHKLLGGVSFEGFGLYAGLDAEYVYDIWHDTAGTIDLSNYLVLNAKLAYTFMERYRAFVNFNNITDEDYSTYYGGPSNPALQGYYPMPGFTVMGGLSVSL